MIHRHAAIDVRQELGRFLLDQGPSVLECNELARARHRGRRCVMRFPNCAQPRRRALMNCVTSQGAGAPWVLLYAVRGSGTSGTTLKARQTD